MKNILMIDAGDCPIGFAVDETVAEGILQHFNKTMGTDDDWCEIKPYKVYESVEEYIKELTENRLRQDLEYAIKDFKNYPLYEVVVVDRTNELPNILFYTRHYDVPNLNDVSLYEPIRAMVKMTPFGCIKAIRERFYVYRAERIAEPGQFSEITDKEDYLKEHI